MRILSIGPRTQQIIKILGAVVSPKARTSLVNQVLGAAPIQSLVVTLNIRSGDRLLRGGLLTVDYEEQV